MIQADVARKAQITFGQYPYIDFEGPIPSIGRRNAALVSQQMRDAGIYPKAVDFFLCGDMYGFAVAQVGWRTKRRFERWRGTDHITGEEFVDSGMITRFDGPDIENVDPLDFGPQPGALSMEQALWAQRRYFRDISQLEEDDALGKWLPGSMAALKASGGPRTDVEERYAERFNIYRSQQVYDARMNEKFAAPVELVDTWGVVPDELAINGVKFILLTVANDSVVMRAREFPYWHGDLDKVFLTYTPHRDPHYMHGIGKIEVVETLQALANRFASQKADTLDRIIDPSILVSSQSGITDETLWMQPNKIIQADGPVDESQIRPLYPDYRGVQAAIQEIGELFKFSQLGTGMVEDTVMGLPGGDRQTKAEYIGRQESTLNRLMLEAVLADIALVEKGADAFRLLNRQFLKPGKAISMLGMDGETDPVSGLRLPPDLRPIDLNDLNMELHARAVGSTKMIGRGARQQDLVMLMQTVQANPAAVGALNWMNFLRYTLKTFNFPHVEEFLNQQRIPAINQLGQDGAALGVGQAQDNLQGAPPELINLLSGGMSG